MLCSRHHSEWMAWLDYRLPPEPIVLINPGSYRVQDVLEHRKHRTQQWKDTINSQQKLIKESCERTCNATRHPSS